MVECHRAKNFFNMRYMLPLTNEEFAKFIVDFDFLILLDGENKERFPILFVLLKDAFDSLRLILPSAIEVRDNRDPESYRET